MKPKRLDRKNINNIFNSQKVSTLSLCMLYNKKATLSWKWAEDEVMQDITEETEESWTLQQRPSSSCLWERGIQVRWRLCGKSGGPPWAFLGGPCWSWYAFWLRSPTFVCIYGFVLRDHGLSKPQLWCATPQGVINQRHREQWDDLAYTQQIRPAVCVHCTQKPPSCPQVAKQGQEGKYTCFSAFGTEHIFVHCHYR